MTDGPLGHRAAREGVEVRAEVGDPDPNMAIEDALRMFPAVEIVISTLPSEQSRWLEHEVVEKTPAVRSTCR